MVRLIVQTRKGVASFRRCGIDFHLKPKVVEVSEEQAERIRNESMLEVQEFVEPPVVDVEVAQYQPEPERKKKKPRKKGSEE